MPLVGYNDLAGRRNILISSPYSDTAHAIALFQFCPDCSPDGRKRSRAA